MAAAEQIDWQHQIARQLTTIGVPDGTSHLVIHRPDDDSPAEIIDLTDSENAGIVSAEDHATRLTGEVMVVPFSQIQPLLTEAAVLDAADALAHTEPGTDPLPQPDTDDPDDDLDPAATVAPEIDLNPNPDTGQLLTMPRIPIVVDDSDPNILKLAFAGSVEIERGDQQWVEFFNKLKPGRTVELELSAFVAGETKTQRRDKEGDVDSVVLTRSLTITDVHYDPAA